MDYKSSGVDIDAGNETVRRIKQLAKSTFTPGVLSEIGSFGGLFKLDTAAWKEPVLVSSADGVGTKLKVAFMANGTARSASTSSITASTTSSCRARRRCSFSTTSRPAGCRRTSPSRSSRAWRAACQDNGCALLGGETAEMPGFYADGEYDVAGFIVGAVDRAQIIDGRSIVPGDVLIGLAVDRPAHQRLFAGAQDRVRGVEADGRQSRAGARRDRRRGAAAPASIVSAGDQAAARHAA